MLRVPRWWPTLIPTILLLLAACAGLRWSGLDTPVFVALNRLGAFVPPLWASLSVTGLGLSAFILLVALSPGRDRAALQAVAALLWCFPIGGLFTHGFKRLFATPRPQAVLPLDQIQVIGEPLLHNSLPSGHAITALATAWLFLHTRRLSPGQQALVWVLTLAVVLSRITTAAHWPSDVLAGAAAGLVAAQLSLLATRRWSAARFLSTGVGQLLLALAQLASGVAMVGADTGYPMALPVQWTLGALAVAGGLWRLVACARARTGGLA
jgi:membrane-associated phospholipid phosphatase